MEREAEAWNWLELELGAEGEDLDLTGRHWVWEPDVATARDRSALVLRCLRVWYDMSPRILITALHTLDCFIARVKVRERHVPCLALAAFRRAAGPEGPSRAELIALSQTRCTVGDLLRMEAELEARGDPQGSPLALAASMATVLGNPVPGDTVGQRLELVMASHRWTFHRSRAVCLSLLEQLIRSGPSTDSLLAGLASLQAACEVYPKELTAATELVAATLVRYELQLRLPRRLRQPLSWRRSHSLCAQPPGLPPLSELPQQTEELQG